MKDTGILIVRHGDVPSDFIEIMYAYPDIDRVMGERARMVISRSSARSKARLCPGRNADTRMVFGPSGNIYRKT